MVGIEFLAPSHCQADLFESEEFLASSCGQAEILVNGRVI